MNIHDRKITNIWIFWKKLILYCFGKNFEFRQDTINVYTLYAIIIDLISHDLN